MSGNIDIVELIHRGGVFEIDAKTADEAYEKISKLIKLPAGMTSEEVCKALCDREKVMPTAVGNGIAIPHARSLTFNDENDQLIFVAYLKNPIDMRAPDGNPVQVMFVLLSQNNQSHLAALSALAALFTKADFKKALELRVGEEKLAAVIKGL